MKTTNKILLAILGIVIIGFLVFFYNGSDLFQGLLKFKSEINSPKLIPAKQKFIKLDKLIPEPVPAKPKLGKLLDELVPEPIPEKSKLIKLDELILGPIPQDWINQFNKDFEITFIYKDCIQCSAPYVAFTEEEKLALKNATYRNFYVASKIDSYFKKTLPWTKGKSLYDWFKDSIDGISYFDNPSKYNKCCKDGKTIVINGRNILNHIKDGNDKGWFSPSSSLSFSDSFIVIYIHEARHANSDDVGHEDCDNDGVKGEDQSLQVMGGYGVSTLFNHWMRYMLPEETINETINKYGEESFSYYGYIDRLCTFDKNNKELDQDDQDWIKSVSGYEIKCDKLCM